MIVTKESLQNTFKYCNKKKDYELFFHEIYKLSNYVIQKKFSNINLYENDIDSVKQECVLSIWNLIRRNKINENNENIYSYVIGSMIFLLRDIIKKNKRRTKIAHVMYGLNT